MRKKREAYEKKEALRALILPDQFQLARQDLKYAIE
jgi:hypothetical protein